MIYGYVEWLLHHKRSWAKDKLAPVKTGLDFLNNGYLLPIRSRAISKEGMVDGLGRQQDWDLFRCLTGPHGSENPVYKYLVMTGLIKLGSLMTDRQMTRTTDNDYKQTS